jgi:D-alanyl-D-alanine dipeptidase
MRLLLGAAAIIGAITSAATVSAAPDAGVPPVSPQAAAAGFVDVRSVVPDAIVDLRYATPDNFVGVQLYPSDARCLVHESLAPGLAAAAGATGPRTGGRARKAVKGGAKGARANRSPRRGGRA